MPPKAVKPTPSNKRKAPVKEEQEDDEEEVMEPAPKRVKIDVHQELITSLVNRTQEAEESAEKFGERNTFLEV